MSQKVEQVANDKSKKIAKKSSGSPLRLWVRAKFLGFRRYYKFYSDQKFNKIPINQFFAFKE